ncbi:hypothetical protein OAN307_c39460 [Octadecabacter antarcticus 307]|uniref:Apea-like HEPN domain-containing protein n=2 Tax=Octadecabacter TaxID=53945 RepID=M9R9N7_9RHOB|nr:hypothetical protein OAN307_c39460 [Octadecabacter antarcticus 307]
MTRKNSFQSMIPGGWCKDPEKSKFLFRLYSIVPCSIARLTEYASGLSSRPNEDGVPIWIDLCEIHADDLTKVGMGQLHSDPETGEIICPTDIGHFSIPRSACFLLATPHEIDGVEFREADTLSRLDRMEALLSIHFGSNAVYRQVFEAIYDAQPGGPYTFFGDVMATLQPFDGPMMASENWRLFEEAISQKDAIRDATKKNRINRALEFYHSGKTSPDTAHGEKFFFYWTAFQIFCEAGGTMATNRQLQSIYKFSKKQVEDDLLWKGIVDLRNNFFHKGVQILLIKDAERYLQLLFLDLLRDELGLEPVRAAFSSQPKLDLRIFGGNAVEGA